MSELEPAVEKQARAVVEGILEELAGRILSYSQENLVKNGTTDTGDLLSSGYAKPTADGWEVGYEAPHAVFIELGTEPHWPPVAPLEKWAGRKLHLDAKEAKGAAFAIRAKIAREGTEPQPFLRPAVEKAISRMRL